VLWIAGSPCSGKSTISHTIARIYVFVDYHVDAWSANHLARLVAAGDAQAVRQKRHGVYDEGGDPDRHHNIIARDRRLARYIHQQAEELSLTVHVVDGSRSRKQMTNLVERHFDPYLRAFFATA
jgi:hypothetical protein